MGLSSDGGRAHRDLTVPMPAMISGDDLRDARDILGAHLPHGIAQICDVCGASWPCIEVRYAWMVTGTPPAR